MDALEALMKMSESQSQSSTKTPTNFLPSSIPPSPLQAPIQMFTNPFSQNVPLNLNLQNEIPASFQQVLLSQPVQFSSSLPNQPNPPQSSGVSFLSSPHPTSTMESPMLSATAVNTITKPPPSTEIIRSSEVEAALRSKPQRGRKRENLNGLERLALTRTRNREHAKHTRLRKKARYEELVENEKKYTKLKEEQELASKKKATILKFLEIRAKLINLKQKNVAQEDNHSSDWNVSFESISSNDEPSAINELKVAAAYRDTIHDASTFVCAIYGSCDTRDCTAMNITELCLHDTLIWNQIQEKLVNHDDSYSLLFQAVNGTDGIAIASNGMNGYTEMTAHHFSRTDCIGKALFSETVKFAFSPESNKILSFTSHLTSSELSNWPTSAKCTNEGSLPLLGYPSVISLDHHANSPVG